MATAYKIRMWHGGTFTNSRHYNGYEHIDLREYDVFENGEACLNELLLVPDSEYVRVLRYAFKDKATGYFKIFNVDDVDIDFVTQSLQFVDDKTNILEIYCECEKGIENGAGIDKSLSKGAVLEKRIEKRAELEKEGAGLGKSLSDGVVLEKVIDKGAVSDSEDEDEDVGEIDLDEVLVEDDPVSDDGLEDNDFSDEDEEFFEARRNKHAYRCKLTESRTEKQKEIEKELGKELIAADFIPVDEEVDSDASYESLDEDGEKKVKTRVYSSNISPKDLKLELGLRFVDHTTCQEVIRDWAVVHGYNIRWTKSSQGKLQAECVKGCKWRMYASKIHGEPTCIIKTLQGEHTCVRAQYNRQANAKFVAKHFLPKMQNCPNISNKEMQTEIRLVYGTTVKPMVCYRGKWRALEQIRGTFYDHYARLRPYIMELMRNDPEGHFELKTFLDKEDRPVFERLYIGFSALRKGFFVGCRRYIGFDACFLKTVLGGALLAAVSKDCNNKMYPIAWAVVEKETEASWTWFFERLFDDLNIGDGLGWTFMSDKQKGLINGIRNIAPNGEHRHCARHIYANWRKNFPGPKFKEHFWRIVKATSKADHDWYFNKMKMESAQAATDFESKGPQSFCKALINSFTKTDTILNNVCETFNSYILRCRDKHLIDMLEDIRMSIMSRIYELSANTEKILDSSDPICPNIRKKMNKIHEMVRHCEVRPAVGGKFEVHCFDDSHVVDLNMRECTCRAWELTGIPCYHGLSSIFYNREDPVAYVDRFYLKTNAMECYKFGISPLRGYKAWPRVAEAPVLPPVYSKAPGRPKKQRKRGIDEVQPPKSQTKLSLRGLRMSCKNCGSFDHNKRTCKEPARVPSSRQPRAKHPSTDTMRAPPLQRETRATRQRNFGQINTESGSIYVQEPVAGRVHFKPSSRGGTQGSQGSQGSSFDRSQVQDPTPP